MEVGAGEQRRDLGFQPVVHVRQRRPIASVVRLVADVRRQPGEIGQRVVLEVGSELAEADPVGLVDVCVVNEWVVVRVVGAADYPAATAVYILDIFLPRLARVL